MTLISFNKDNAECNCSVSSLNSDNIEIIENEMYYFLENLDYFLKGKSREEYLKYWDYFDSKKLKENLKSIYLFFKESDNFSFLIDYNENLLNNNSVKYEDLNIFDFIEFFENWDDQIEIINSYYVEEEIERNKEFFDELNLNDGQREAVVVDEDSTQIIAGAGTGKTRTLIANVKYLVEKKNIEPSKILCLSYSTKSTDDLRNRIRKIGIPASKQLKKGKVRVATFHSFGFRFSNRTFDKDLLDSIFLDYVKEMVVKDISIFEKFKLYFSSEFNSRPIFTAEDNDGIALKFKDNSHGEFETIRKGLTVKSYEDLIIANFLILNDVKFNYCYKYPVNYTDNLKDYHKLSKKNGNHVEDYLSIEADFYLPDYDIYIEDNRIDKNGNPSWIKEVIANDFYMYDLNQKIEMEEYKSQIAFKKNLAKEKDINIISINSLTDSNFLETLHEKLEQNNVELELISEDRLMKMLNFIDFFDHFKDIEDIVKDFISSFKEHDIPDDDIYKYEGEDDKERFLLKFIADYYFYYKEYLDEFDLLDFPDMILRAIPRIRDTEYDYIFVDEYQAISQIRYKLLKNIKEDSNAKLIVVGDDWQSIFGFNGCDVKYFANFNEYFPIFKKVYLNQTYRSSNQLITTAGEFVDNQNLITKELYSQKINEYPIKLWAYKKGFENIMVYNILEEISKYAEDREVKILSRYNENLNSIKRDLESICTAENLKLDISFETFHRAKGLEAENVIILDVNDDVKGIPSKITDSGILRFVSFQGDKIKQDLEERRLFYVGLTRTKNNVYLCADKLNISPFIDELNEDVIERRNYIPPRGFNPFSTSTKSILKHFWQYRELIKSFDLKCKGCEKGEINLYKINKDAYIVCSEYGNGCHWYVDKKFDLEHAETMEIEYCPKCNEGILYDTDDLKIKPKKKAKVCSNIRCGKKQHKNREFTRTRKGFGLTKSVKVNNHNAGSLLANDTPNSSGINISKKDRKPSLVDEILNNKINSEDNKKSSLVKSGKDNRTIKGKSSSNSATIEGFCNNSDKFRDGLRNQAKAIGSSQLNSDQKFALMQLDMFSISKVGKFSKDFKKSLEEKRVSEEVAYKIKKDVEYLIILDIVKRNQVRSALKSLTEKANVIYRER